MRDRRDGESSAGRESVCPAVAPYVPPLLKRPAQLFSFSRAVLPDREVSPGGHLSGGRDGK